MNQQEMLIWAAGFFDGEGCISISGSKKAKRINHLWYTLQLTAYQNDPAPLHLFVSLFGGRILLRKGERGAIWQQTGSGTINTLSKMLPYLIVKRAQAEIAIAFQKRKAPRGGKYEDPITANQLDAVDFHNIRQLKQVIGE